MTANLPIPVKRNQEMGVWQFFSLNRVIKFCRISIFMAAKSMIYINVLINSTMNTKCLGGLLKSRIISILHFVNPKLFKYHQNHFFL
jgi:hypothetical protein